MVTQIFMLMLKPIFNNRVFQKRSLCKHQEAFDK